MTQKINKNASTKTQISENVILNFLEGFDAQKIKKYKNVSDLALHYAEEVEKLQKQKNIQIKRNLKRKMDLSVLYEYIRVWKVGTDKEKVREKAAFFFKEIDHVKLSPEKKCNYGKMIDYCFENKYDHIDFFKAVKKNTMGKFFNQTGSSKLDPKQKKKLKRLSMTLKKNRMAAIDMTGAPDDSTILLIGTKKKNQLIYFDYASISKDIIDATIKMINEEIKKRKKR